MNVERAGSDGMHSPRLVASVEPSVVFASLAAWSVPELCDDCSIDIVEGAQARYRIAHPPQADSTGGLRRLADRAGAESGHRMQITFAAPAPLAGRSFDAGRADLTALARSFPRVPDFQSFQGSATFVWHRRGATRTDRAMAELLVENAIHLVGLQRSEHIAQVAAANVEGLRLALQSSRHIGAAIGILMSQHKISADGAFEMLSEASQHAHRKLRDVALDVVHTGWLEPAAPPRGP